MSSTRFLLIDMSFSKYYHTLKYLRGDQFFHRVSHALKSRLYPVKPYRINTSIDFRLPGTASHFPLRHGKYLGGNKFRLLNIEHDFQGQIDWSYDKYGMLWTFQLNYFDYLLDESCTHEDAVRLMDEWCHAEPGLTVGKMAYPISLRTINWLKAMIRFGHAESRHVAAIKCELQRLMSNLEYHVLGNHLLENALALIFGGLSFQEQQWLTKGLHLLDQEIPEQFLDDGGHFERSTMYQQILLERMLDTLNVARASSMGKPVMERLEPLVMRMFGWLDQMTFPNGELAHVNDSAPGMSMPTQALSTYSRELSICVDPAPHPLGASGYRRMDLGSLSCIMDAGDVGPDYLPAHAHSDTLSFCLAVHGHPCIVDTGTSTYQPDAIRQRERSTSSHNTVVIDGREQSEAWGSFRMARRAHARILEEGEGLLKATHDGYQRFGADHIREWTWSEGTLVVTDEVWGGSNYEAFLHLAPGLDIEQKADGLYVAGPLSLTFIGAQRIIIEDYEFAEGFNMRKPAARFRVSFTGSLRTECRSI